MSGGAKVADGSWVFATLLVKLPATGMVSMLLSMPGSYQHVWLRHIGYGASVEAVAPARGSSGGSGTSTYGCLPGCELPGGRGSVIVCGRGEGQVRG